MSGRGNPLAELRERVVEACRHLAGAGLSPGSSGNVSVRVGDQVLITPTGSALRRVRADDLAQVDAGSPVGNRPRPSKELPVHLAVYRQRPQATAVVHLHSPYATACACLPPDGRGLAQLPPLTPYRVMRLGDVPLAPYAKPGSSALGDGVEKLAAKHHVILLANHGSVVAGESLDSAVELSEELETAAQLTLLLRAQPAVHLTPAQTATLCG
ncbi:class II aldolase/adducin family protein [Kribbella turkmenica]|uniref:class II aldolase/adducin family protein n=1 Tax=Kribbella turkmenica TaxID=2530375 RepID=UPI00192D2FB8|nr:class II aldolase/adducin family protein [Kribbella turkmenica]